jgi:hypothetical protein
MRIRAFANYLVSGFACGLGGMLLLGVPSFILTFGFFETRQFFIHNHLPVPPELAWVSRASAFTGVQLEPYVGTVGLLGLPVFGFLFGWLKGMRHDEVAQRHLPTKRFYHAKA